MADESGLVRRLREGDEDAFRELVGRHQQEVYRLARAMVHDHDDADEVAQRTFIAVFRKIGGFRGDSSLRTWIFRIAINQARNHLRGRKPQGEMKIVERHLADPAPPADQALADRERRALVARAVEGLPQLQKAVVTLRTAHDLSYDEIAGIVGCSPGSAKVNFHHAVRRLRALLSEEPTG